MYAFMDCRAPRDRGNSRSPVQSRGVSDSRDGLESSVAVTAADTPPAGERAACEWPLAMEATAAVRYRSIFHQVPVGIAQTTVDNRILEANPHLCAMLGYSAAELCCISTRDLTYPEDRDQHDHLRRQLLAGEIPVFCAHKRFVRKDGKWIWINRTVTLARDAANDSPYLIQVIEDITERKRTQELHEQAEAQAREHERRYHETFDQVGVGIAHTSFDGLYLRANRRFCEMLGYAESELLGRRAADFTHPDDRGRGEAFRDEMLAGRIPKYQDQKRYLRKDASVVWTSRTVSLARGAAGEPMYFIRVIEDITERRKIEANYRATFDNAPVGIVHTAFADGRILRANRKFSEMLGYSEAELLQRSGLSLVHPDMAGSDTDKYRQRLVDGDGETFASERKFVCKDGSSIWVNRTVSLVKDAAGKPDYFIRIVEDISERILSAQRRAMEHAVAKVLAEGTSMEEAMPNLIRTMCEVGGWSYGTHWCWSEAQKTLVRSALWGGVDMRFEGDDQEIPWTRLRYRNHGGLVGRAWFEGKPCWIEDMRTNTTFNRRHAALQFGFHSALSFPVTADGVTIGVMEFFGRDVRKPDEVLLQTVGSIGRQIGQFIQRRQAEQALRVSEERYRDIFESSPLPMWVRDDETSAIITVNQAAIDHYGYSRDEFMRMNLRDLWDPAEHDSYERKGRNRGYCELLVLKRRHRTKDGRLLDIEATARAFELGGRRVWLTLLNDITERLRTEQKLLHLAHYDVLTGLPNRVLFYERLKQALVQARRNRWITGVMFMDVDRFKNINDTLGHDVGDELLRQVSQRLAASVRSSDTVGRLGGDEFAVVLADLATREDASLVAQKIMKNFNEPFRLSGAEIFVTISIGITLAPDDGTEQEALIKNADAAMYRAKEEGRNTFRYYTPDMSARALRLLTLEGSLRRALERDEFLLHYQPKTAVATGAITGVEALLRWRHPDRGLVPPGEFIPVLEETGLIVQASEWVLNAVCKQLRQWQQAGIAVLPVAVNLSAREFLAPDLARTIKRILDSHAIAPSLLELEITESSLMVNPQEAARTLEYLKSLGVGLAIDDFGTGYSSLSYLKRFPLDALKVDRSFVRDITSDANDAAITLAVISMAHSLGLKVVAEGVENAAQLAFLAQHGCDQVQGFFLARPMDADACGELLMTPRVLP
jgi:diguanylate cyclase (GGDEF)-like protein/PAS domain S-box-containing protein